VQQTRAPHCKKGRGKNQKSTEKITQSPCCKEKEIECHAAKQKSTVLQKDRAVQCNAKTDICSTKRKKNEQHDATQDHRALVVEKR